MKIIRTITNLLQIIVFSLILWIILYLYFTTDDYFSLQNYEQKLDEWHQKLQEYEQLIDDKDKLI